MKKLRIEEFNKFLNSERPSNLFSRIYINGYWNIYNYSEEAEQWLVDNNIKYTIEND
jgi:hypothetical protein